MSLICKEGVNNFFHTANVVLLSSDLASFIVQSDEEQFIQHLSHFPVKEVQCNVMTMTMCTSVSSSS